MSHNKKKIDIAVYFKTISIETAKRFGDKIVPGKNGCWEWTGSKNNRGYGTFCFQGRRVLAHRFAFLLANGRLDPNKIVHHVCNNPSCVNPAHLQEVTQSVNVLESLRTNGRVKRNTKFTYEVAEDIRHRYEHTNVTFKDLANEYGTSEYYIKKIVHNQKWKRRTK